MHAQRESTGAPQRVRLSFLIKTGTFLLTRRIELTRSSPVLHHFAITREAIVARLLERERSARDAIRSVEGGNGLLRTLYSRDDK